MRNPTPTVEGRPLKIAGVILVALCLVPLKLSGQLDTPSAHVSPAVMLELYLTGNAMAIAALFILAGEKHMRLRSNPRARNGVLFKLAGANVLVVAAILLRVLNDIAPEDDRVAILHPVVALVFGLPALSLILQGFKWDARSAPEVVKADPRPPVVYLRAFSVDKSTLLTGWRRWVSMILPFRFEQDLVDVVRHLGPVVAVGRPGERLPELGAARFYFTDEEWREKVTDLISRARLVIIRGSLTGSLLWEIETARRLTPPQRLLIISVGAGGGDSEFETELETRLSNAARIATPARPRTLGSRVRELFIPTMQRFAGKIIYFDPAWQRQVQLIQLTSGMRSLLQWRYYEDQMQARPLRAGLESAFDRVFNEIGLPQRIPGKSRWLAACLAFGFGLIGAQYFYLGDRRQALHCARRCLTFVPAFLGWRDAVRWILMEEHEFAHAYPTHESIRSSRLREERPT